MKRMDEEKNQSMQEKFPSNSYTEIRPIEEYSMVRKKTEKDSETKKKVQAKEHRKTFGERISENFMNFDREQIKDRLIFDWLLPEIISTVDDILRMIFFGDRNGGGRRSRRDRRDGYTSYNSIYDEKRRDRDDRPDPTRQNFKHIRLEFYTKEDAEDILDDLRESLAESENGWVSVKELYSLSNLPTNSAMWKWGWNDLEDCMIERRGEDYVLMMPRAEVIR